MQYSYDIRTEDGMDANCKNLDDFCIWLERIVSWVDRTGTPPIPWIGQAGGRFNNPPAPHVEFTFTMEGRWENVAIGPRTVFIPEHHVSLHNVHVGNLSPAAPGIRMAWCCFLDMRDAPEFAVLKQEPLFCCVPVTDRPRLASAFAELQTRCAMALGPSTGYLGGTYAYEPSRAEALSMAQRLSIKSACLNLLSAILREGERQREGSSRLPDAVQKALAWLSLHSRDPELRLEDVAAHAGLSVDHFGRVFRETLHTSPMRHLQAIRIEHSRFLLRHTRLNIGEVALEVGFSDPYYFSRVFRRATGTSPRAFRR